MKIIKVLMIMFACLCSAVVLWATISIQEITIDILPTYPSLETNLSSYSQDDTLLDVENFEFVMNNASICANSQNDNYSSLLIMVFSARSYFGQRYAIRNTWGSIKTLKQWNFRLIFLLGIDPDDSPEIESQLSEESTLHGDIVMGNFVDSYENLTYKHMMAYKWARTFCSTATFILKSDDDMFIDIFELVEAILPELLHTKQRYSYACFKLVGSKCIRDRSSKWYVSEDLYPESKYPDYCAGYAFLMKTDDVGKLYSMGNKTNFFWIDDVFITGILREKYNLLLNNTINGTLDIFQLGTRFRCNGKAEIINWCRKGLDAGQLNSTFIVLNKNDYISDMFCLWDKVRIMRYAMKTVVGE